MTMGEFLLGLLIIAVIEVAAVFVMYRMSGWRL